MSIATEVGPRRRSQRILRQHLPRWLVKDCERLERNDPSLSVLIRSAKAMGENGAVALGMALKHNTMLQELLIGWNAIGNSGVAAISNGLGQRPKDCDVLAELNLACNEIDHDGVKALADGLGTQRGFVQVLNLSHNHIGSRGAQLLADWLNQQQENHVTHQLTALFLGNNRIGNNGAFTLGYVVEKHRNLNALYLNENLVSEEGIRAISRGLATPTCILQTLDLRGNPLGNHGAEALGEALKHNMSLKTLCLSWSRIEGTGIMAIARGLQHNTCLETLTLLRNKPSITSARSLLEVLVTRNKTIQWLYLFHINSLESAEKNRLTQIQHQINYYCALNRAGRRHIGDVTLPWSLWPRVFARISTEENLIYGFLCEKPDLFQRCNISSTSNVPANLNSVSTTAKKRQYDKISS